jgi:uncharacterized DUF497 family protein
MARCYMEGLIFEFDHAKSVANLRKHGIDFQEAQALWLDPEALELTGRVVNEPRWIVVGRIGDKIWSAVITRRNEYVRLISVRRARKRETELYESQDL